MSDGPVPLYIPNHLEILELALSLLLVKAIVGKDYYFQDFRDWTHRLPKTVKIFRETQGMEFKALNCGYRDVVWGTRGREYKASPDLRSYLVDMISITTTEHMGMLKRSPTAQPVYRKNIEEELEGLRWIRSNVVKLSFDELAMSCKQYWSAEFFNDLVARWLMNGRGGAIASAPWIQSLPEGQIRMLLGEGRGIHGSPSTRL